MSPEQHHEQADLLTEVAGNALLAIDMQSRAPYDPAQEQHIANLIALAGVHAQLASLED